MCSPHFFHGLLVESGQLYFHGLIPSCEGEPHVLDAVHFLPISNWAIIYDVRLLTNLFVSKNVKLLWEIGKTLG